MLKDTCSRWLFEWVTEGFDGNDRHYKTNNKVIKHMSDKEFNTYCKGFENNLSFKATYLD